MTGPAQTLPMLALIALLATACGAQNVPAGIKGFAKSDVDYLLDKHLHNTEDNLLLLMEELYRLNPEQLAKTPDATVAKRTALLLPNRSYDELRFDEINGHRGRGAIRLAFHPRFKGDRVFTLMIGLVSQMRIAYNDQLEFFMFDQVHAKNLSVFRTNLEVVGLSLQRQTGKDGAPLLRFKPQRTTADAKQLQPPGVLQILERTVGQLQVLIDIGDDERRTTAGATRTATMLLLPLPIP